jgi:predicted transcriptional regulator
MKNRSKLDIVSAILNAAQGGALKTQIMYYAFLSVPQLKEYLELLQKSGVLEYMPEKRLYYTTERGRSFLRSYIEVGQLLYPKESKIAMEIADA